jgi:hypothetical protein
MKARKPTTAPVSAPTSTDIALIAQGMRDAIATADPSEEPRALPIYDDAPSGHTLFRVEDGRHEPHLHDGEWVVVDTTAREIVWGELYLVLQSRGPILWQINRFKAEPHGRVGDGSGRACAMLSPLNKPRLLPDGSLDTRHSVHLSDGPICVDYLEGNLLGRVVGIIDPQDRMERKHRAAMLRKAERAARERRTPPQSEGGAA